MKTVTELRELAKANGWLEDIVRQEGSGKHVVIRLLEWRRGAEYLTLNFDQRGMPTDARTARQRGPAGANAAHAAAGLREWAEKQLTAAEPLRSGAAPIG